MAIADTLEYLPKKDPQYKQLQAIARRLGHGLESTQDADGLWHTVLDDPKSYAECSATAMFVYGILKLSRLNAWPHSADARAAKAWKAINQRYVQDGVVGGVSAGTGPRGREAYNRIAVGTETWGTGAYLLAASEIERQRK
jgi:unsaturated rhamnogalacturonyl hydrolase